MTTSSDQTEEKRARARDLRLRRTFGISAEEYDQLLEHQKGVCAICGNPPKKQRLHVDHDHKTGQLLGLLCWPCNSKLSERVTVEWLEKATEYLREPPAVVALGEPRFGQKGRVTKRRRRRRSADNNK